MSKFKLFPEESNFWSFSDYQCVLDVMERLCPKRVLEFGPGYSTLALVEGGAKSIVCLESEDVWLETWRERHGSFPQIEILQYFYFCGTPVYPWLEDFDLGLVDGPHCTEERPSAIRYCLKHCEAVLVPTEDEGRKAESFLRPHIVSLAEEFNCSLEWMETGPKAGGFALMVKR